jgi:hypothetical protein
MTRFTLAALMLAASTAAVMAQGTPQQRSACRSDVVRYCKNAGEDTGAIHFCLQSNYAKISDRCKKVLAGG